MDSPASVSGRRPESAPPALHPKLFTSPTHGVLFESLPDRRVLDVNDEFCRMFGVSRETATAGTTDFMYPSRAEFERMGAAIDPLVGEEGSGTLEWTLRRHDGQEFPAEVTIIEVNGAAGERSGVVKVIRDLTSVKRHEAREAKEREREAFLNEASALLLGASLDPEETLKLVAQLATRVLGDYANVELLEEAASATRRVTIAHADPGKAHLIRAYAERYPPRPHLRSIIRGLAPTGHVLTNDIDLKLVESYADRPGEMELISQLGLKHHLLVPLVGRRGLLGALGFTRARGEPYGEDDVRLAKSLAARAALAYENASLYQQAGEMEARWRSLVEHNQDWIYLADRDGRVLHINRGRGAMKPSDIIGKSLYSWLAPEEAARFRSSFDHVFATAEPATVSTSAVIGGELSHFDCRIAPVVDPEGRVTHATVTTTDVTERVRVHEDLRRSTAALSDFVETSAVGLHWVGPDGTILWANPADHLLLGYPREEFVGRDIREFHADPEVIADILARLARDERLHEVPARLRAKDGSIRHVLIDSSVYWEDGQFVHTRCFTRDVTAQRVAEERLRSSEERLRRILDTAPVQVLTIDAAGTILTVNRRVRGADPSGAAGINAFDTIVEEDRARVRAIIERSMRTGDIAEYETRGIVAPGDVRWFSVRVGPLDLGGARGAVLVSTDIEERKRIQDEFARMRAQLIQGEKLAALGTLVSGVAHELRTPLTYLANNAFLLQLRLEAAAKRDASAGEAYAEARAFLSEITEGVDRINMLVEDLRKYTRARKEAALVDAPLDVLLAEAIELFTATSRTSHVVETSLGATPRVRANKGTVQQLVLNLLLNAAEASPPGSPIRISTRSAEGGAVLEVTDEGTGIAAHVLDRMYDPLFTTKAEGTGLGLSIVKRIVEAHHARIECESVVGKGTTFRVTFPASPPG